MHRQVYPCDVVLLLVNVWIPFSLSNLKLRVILSQCGGTEEWPLRCLSGEPLTAPVLSVCLLKARLETLCSIKQGWGAGRWPNEA